MSITEGSHLGLKTINIDSKSLRLKVIPELGFKIASIVYKPLEKEFLFQPSKGKYDLPEFGGDFSKYDTSGLDEMLPTVDACIYPEENFKGKILPDHGDLWSLAFDTEIEADKISGRVELKSLPLAFEKKISFKDETTIKMEYKVINLGDKKIFYLWTLHGLNNFDDYTELVFPKGVEEVLNVQGDEDLNQMDLKSLSAYEDGKSYKYYFLGDIKRGQAGLRYKKERLQYTIDYDSEINPYLGVWITKGGFKGEYNCAIEPSNGFYDSLELAYKNKKVASLEAGEEKSWTLLINIDKY
nr:hypothetical protein [Tissierella sp.]